VVIFGPLADAATEKLAKEMPDQFVIASTLLLLCVCVCVCVCVYDQIYIKEKQINTITMQTISIDIYK